METRRYTFKLYPNKAQTEAIERQCVLLARLWNAALQEREDQWRREVERKGHWRRIARPADEKPKGLSYFDQAKAIKQIRADDPEYAAMSCASMELCLKALDLAFKAFWRRLKDGCDAGSAGYPKYKAAKRHRTIWHRDGSGWKMTPSGKHWKFYFKGIPGTIKARGRFPLHPDEIRTMEIIERDGAWCASVVVRQQPRMTPGKMDLQVEFDLLDSFAVVKNAANGECLPGLTPVFNAGEGRIIPQNHGGSQQSVAEASAFGADGRGTRIGWHANRVAQASDFGADGRKLTKTLIDKAVAEASAFGADGRVGSISASTSPVAQASDLHAAGRVDAVQSERDKRYKKFSYRWKREARRIARMKAKEARGRREDLHRWTTLVIQSASEITVVAPPIRENTESGRGDKYEWGGAVKTVAALNRNTLSQAPALAIQMLEYKAAEAGIPFRVVQPEDAKLAVGRDLKKTVQTTRKVRRKLKEAA